MSYHYINTSTTTAPPIIYSRWEVRDSAGNLLVTLEDVGKIDLYYAFPFLDTFTVRLLVRDSALNEDFEIKTYVIDTCPICVSGGGGPSIPTLAQKYADPPGNIYVTDITTIDLDACDIKVKAKKINALDFESPEFNVKVKLIKKETL